MAISDLFSGVGDEFMKMITTIGVLVAVVGIFYLWSSWGTFGLVLIIVVLAAGALGWWLWNGR